MKNRMASWRNRWNNAKMTKTNTFWIAVAAVTLAIFLGFSQAGWVTGQTASIMSDRTSEDAVIARLAIICVAQFEQDEQKSEKMAELTEISTATQRTIFVKNAGWATMPGDTEPDDKVARACAQQLVSLNQ
jgi:hypothetical protein